MLGRVRFPVEGEVDEHDEHRGDREPKGQAEDHLSRRLVAAPAPLDSTQRSTKAMPRSSRTVTKSSTSWRPIYGAMCAPRPERVARELVRVCRRGATIGMANWTQEGFIGRMLQTIGKFVAPPGMPSPLLWGTRDDRA